MKKLATLVLFATAVAISQAQVTPSPSFPTPPFWQENFDTLAQGQYNSTPLFSGWGGVNRIGTFGALIVRSFAGSVSVPNVMYGDGVDMRVGSLVPMKRFSGWFRAIPFSSPSTTVQFLFKDFFGFTIGSVTMPLTLGWTFYSWQTSPLWARVEIYGNISGFAGGVAMDSLSMRPW